MRSNRSGGGDHLERVDIFKDISKRTNGDIYLGVVGAVRTGSQHSLKNLWKKQYYPTLKMKVTV